MRSVQSWWQKVKQPSKADKHTTLVHQEPQQWAQLFLGEAVFLSRDRTTAPPEQSGHTLSIRRESHTVVPSVEQS